MRLREGSDLNDKGKKKNGPAACPASQTPARGACALRRPRRLRTAPPTAQPPSSASHTIPPTPFRIARTRKLLSSRKPRRLPNACPSPTPSRREGPGACAEAPPP